VDDAAGGHHHQVVGLQGMGDLVQHADHRAAVAPSARTSAASRPGAAGPGWPAARPSAARSACTASARASSTRWRSPPDRRPSGVRASPRPGCAQRLLHGRAVGAPRRRQPALCGRRPSMATSYTVRSSAAALVLAQPGRCARALAPLHAAERLACSSTSPRVRQQAGQHAQQRRLAGAVGADDAGPAARGRSAGRSVQHLALPPVPARRTRALQCLVPTAAAHANAPRALRRCISHSR
jgi:hypothetical protein